MKRSALVPFSLLFSISCSALADAYNPDTDWMAGKVGIFQHYLFNRTPVEKALREMHRFDAEGLARQLDEMGADFFCITLLQVWPSLAAPNDVYEDIAGHPRGADSSRYDIPAALIRALKPRGIRLMLYAPGAAPRIDREACRRFGFRMPADPGLDPIYTRKGAESWARVLEFWSRRYGTDVVGWWIDGCNRGECIAPDVQAPTLYAKALKSGNPHAVVAFNPGMTLGKFVEEDDYTAGEVNEPFMTSCGARWAEGRQWQVLTYTYQPLMFPDTVRYTDTEWIDWLGPVLSRGGCVTLDALGNVPTGLIDADRAAQLKNVLRTSRGEEPSPEVAAKFALERRIRRVTDLIDANGREHLHPERLRAFVTIDHARQGLVPDAALVTANAAGERLWSAAIRKTLDEKGGVHIPASATPYYLDAPIVLKGGQSLTGGGLRYPLRDGCSAKLMPAKGYDGPLLVVENAKNVHVRGPIFCGVRDPVRFTNVDGLSVREVAFRDCRGTAVSLAGCRNFRVDAVRLETPAADAGCGVRADAATALGMIRNVRVIGADAVAPVCAAGADLIVECNSNRPLPPPEPKKMAAFDYVIGGETRCRIEPSGHPDVDAEIARFTNAVRQATGVSVPVRGAASLTETLSRMTFAVVDGVVDFYDISYPEAGHMLVRGTATGCRWALQRLLCDDFGATFTADGITCPKRVNATAASMPDHSAPYPRKGDRSPQSSKEEIQ